MTLTEGLVARAKAYAEKQDMALATLSTRLFNDGKILTKLEQGDGRITVERFESAIKKLEALESATPSTEASAA